MTVGRTSIPLRGIGVASAVALLVAGCGPIPPLAPDTLPPTTIPVVEPNEDYSGIDTNDGFTNQQHTSVRLRVRTCEGWGNGTGFILDDSTIVTNAHVIADAEWIEITTYDGRDYTALSSHVAPVADLGLVQVEPVFTEFVTLSDTPLADGDEIEIVGYPEGQRLTVETGTYEGTEADSVAGTGEQVHTFSAYTLPGNSGSPVYDVEGRVVSVVYASDTESWTGGWPVSWLTELLDDPSSWIDNLPTC